MKSTGIMRKVVIAALVGLILWLAGCKNNYEQITKKIQYDVNIISPDPEYDWWIQNLVGPDREKLVDLIIDGAKEGKWQAYDYFNEPITPAEVRNLFSDSVYLTMIQKDPPYEFYDTLIVNNILNTDIQRLRFLEEWYIDPETLKFDKKILGLAPVAKRKDFQGITRWQPMFWIYVDDEFVKGWLTNKKHYYYENYIS